MVKIDHLIFLNNALKRLNGDSCYAELIASIIQEYGKVSIAAELSGNSHILTFRIFVL